MRLIFPLLGSFVSALLFCGSAMADTFYVDYASGDDSRSGRKPEEAWKHAPGDPQAKGDAALMKAQAGDVVQFRGGVVYRGSVAVPASGEEGKPLVYKGTGWGEGRAIVDGSEVISGWRKCESAADAGGNSNFANLYYAEIQAESPFINLQEQEGEGVESRFLYVAQSPNPADPFFNDRTDSFHTLKQENLTTTSVTDPEVFASDDPKHFEGASLLLWLYHNVVKRVEIESYDPSAKKVTFADVKQSSIYPDGRDQYYAIYNSPHAIDQAGEYSVGLPDSSGKRRIVLWPFSPENLDQRISYSMREQEAFHFSGQSHVTIEGFVIQKFVGGTGICAERAGKQTSGGLVVRDNIIRKNSASADRGRGGVFLTGVSGAVIENNDVQWNKNMRAIFATRSDNIIIRNNDVSHAGTTAVVMYTCKNSQILNNRIDSVLATHANAITLYVGCENVVVAGNFVTNASNPVTFQNSAPLYFFNNVVSGGYGVTEWPNKTKQPDPKGRIVFANNTFVDAKTGLSVGMDPEKEFVVVNNILSGLSVGSSKNRTGEFKLTNSHNIFTKLGHFQQERYGWKMGEAETQFEDMNALFIDPEKLDFRLKPGSPAIGAGKDVSQYYPKDVFPDLNFDEIAGVTKPINIGAEGKKPGAAK